MNRPRSAFRALAPKCRVAIAAAALATGCTATSAASAQELKLGAGTALDRYEAAPYGDALMGLPSAHVWGALRPAFGALFNGSYRPLVIRRDGELGADIVSYQLMLHLLASVELFERLKLDVNAPLTMAQAGESLDAAGFGAVDSGAALNDIRVGARIELLKQRGYWPSAALAFDVWLPTGDRSNYTSTGQTRYAPSIIVGGDHEDFVWTTMVSRRFQPAYSTAPTLAPDVSENDDARSEDLLGSEVRFGVGGGPRFGDLLVSAEVFGSVVTQDGQNPATTAGEPLLNLEVQLAARYDFGPLRLRLSAGPGLTQAPGTPTFRGVFSVGYVMPIDMAARWRGEHNGGATAEPDEGTGAGAKVPPTPTPVAKDSDGDGLADAQDACPRKKGDPANAERPGCPPDRDGDGTPDAEDACPAVAGVRSSDPKEDGCPPDTDGDGLRDPDDACPREAGKITDDPKTSGCLEAVRVVGTQIVILQKVEFETARAIILPVSQSLLEQVAAVLRARPEIVRLVVEGHTDSTGSEQGNISLSQRRAVAVMLWLVDHGVDSRRLEARGYGPRRPIADNKTKAGRAENRRVQFQILRRDPRGEAAWEDGKVEESADEGAGAKP